MNLKVFLPIFLIIITLGGIYAQCTSTQIDINSANANSLDKIYGIGPAKAQNIISYRNVQRFNSLDDLINVSGIGDITLQGIRNQNLACVATPSENQTAKISNNSEETLSSTSNSTLDNTESLSSGNPAGQNQIVPNSSGPSSTITTKVIELSPRNKSSNNLGGFSLTKIWKSQNLPIYGLFAFGIFIGALFLGRKFKTKRYKSEFS